jgi:hypothetical protein
MKSIELLDYDYKSNQVCLPNSLFDELITTFKSPIVQKQLA